ncbi:hypothetical protein V5F77_07320 [Xanthobacter sp. DSM 24535]|uniref:hypothetical protein n=1 Tax=Roseixanthobacter psychrophilus TaxID=3119917 RepID=UPI0037265B66
MNARSTFAQRVKFRNGIVAEDVLRVNTSSFFTKWIFKMKLRFDRTLLEQAKCDAACYRQIKRFGVKDVVADDAAEDFLPLLRARSPLSGTADHSGRSI